MRHELRGTKVLVAGLGKSGIAAIDVLRRQGAEVLATDSRPAEEIGDVGVPVLPHIEETFTRADLIVLSPGVPVDIPPLAAARSKGVPVIGEVELAGYFLRGPVIGITGSNGKTTTTAMTGHILNSAGIRCQVGGNIGTPPGAMIDSSADDKWNVLELSSFQLETIDEFQARVAVGLNVTPDHLDRHGTLTRYADAKARLFECQREDGYAVLNADDGTTASWSGRTRATPHWFSRKRVVRPGVWVEDEILMTDSGRILRVADIPLRGTHNVENTMAAACAALLAGASLEGIAAGIVSFPGVEHRIEFVRERNGVVFYNDSKATNVDAAEKAIDAFAGNLYIILGGKDKNSNYTVLQEKLAAKAKAVLLIGAASEKIAAQLPTLPLVPCGTIDKAVEYSARHAVSGDVVLLAPACASFDQFQSYEHRGRVFKELVRSL
jgi:UDP-N-acetylmuramoylalanine--D-glutamate ligase